MRFHAQWPSSRFLLNAYKKEEKCFKGIVQLVLISKVPPHANIVRSHVLYKFKLNDDETLKLKARIAPYGNVDSEKQNLKTDCCICPPTGIRMLLSISNIFKWSIIKIDVTSAFLQTGEAQKDVLVILPKGSNGKSHYWLLLSATYGLVNANAKFQAQSDELLLNNGFFV